jgi:hypothetical protein
MADNGEANRPPTASEQAVAMGVPLELGTGAGSTGPLGLKASWATVLPSPTW